MPGNGQVRFGERAEETHRLERSVARLGPTPRGAGARHRSPSPRDQGADGRAHGGADAFDALAREDNVDDGFDLLGFRIVRAPWRGGKRVAYTFPSKRALRDVMHRIKTLTNRSTTNLSLDQLIHALNPILRGWTNYHRHNASKRCFAYLSYYLWWRVIRWLRKKYPRLTWKQIRRRCWGRHWTSREGTKLAWPAEVSVTRYQYRGHRIPSPWATTRTGRATTRPGTAVA